jgi:hypothetical protein
MMLALRLGAVVRIPAAYAPTEANAMWPKVTMPEEPMNV